MRALRSAKSIVLRTRFGVVAREVWHRFRPDFLTPRMILKNDEYDRSTALIIKTLAPTAHCVDVGAHQGTILAHLLAQTPLGRHWAVEPLPHLARDLRRHFPTVEVVERALGAAPGSSTFQHVTNHEAYSGLKRRPYDANDVELKEITVQVDRLDRVIPADVPVDFIKIDVEGGELDVLKGAEGLLTRYRPLVVFEHGRPAAASYGASSGDIFDLLARSGLQVSLLPDWLASRPPLSRHQFCTQEHDWYFVAHPPRH